MSTSNQALRQWVEDAAALTQADRIHWCDGSQEEYRMLIGQMLDSGLMLELNPDTHPNCYLHRSDPNDVARTEHLTYVCTRKEADAGPNNNWMEPEQAHRKADALFRGAMKGRTLYVVPYCMGPIDSPLARCGVEITDSPYVVANMRIMTRMGKPALARIERDGTFIRGLHSLGDLDPERRLIMHFPEELTIKSVGSGYGGNALLGKKCHALRIASWQAQDEGWLAEHMLIMGLETPDGEIHYVVGAFPSACGKTNLAMLIPPGSYRGWRIWTLGDDIAWMRVGQDGRLWAINPEAGFFGVAPGTSRRTNANALAMLHHDTIFTNVAVNGLNQPYWEGMADDVPVLDWQGRPYQAANGPAAHPNARFTVSIKQCPSYSEQAEASNGVPISAILFGGRRADTVPLVVEARDWRHGVLMGAGMTSETTAAATGEVGVVRRDPMAMKPFCGYNYGDYWAHWLSFEEKAARLPKVFTVNWFRRDGNGRFMWPGYGENLRVLEWIINRCRGSAPAVDTPIGQVPSPEAINTDGLEVDASTIAELTAVDAQKWHDEVASLAEYLASYGEHVPAALWAEHRRLSEALK